MRKIYIGLFINIVLLTPQVAIAQSVAVSEDASRQPYFDHSAFDALLSQHVKPINGSTAVDYGAFQKDQAALKIYITALSKISQKEFDAWPKDHQLAFLINAYNAATIELILTRYPNLDSIRDIRSAWQRKFINLFGDKISLDNIEHDMIRGSDRYNDPRIHFAVNCASIGCPALLNEAYRGGNLDKQLDRSTYAFLSDRSRNYYKNKRIYISKIFSWYRKDFEQGWRGANNLAQFLSLYDEALNLDEKQKAQLKAGKMKIKHPSYDWRLNSVQ